MFLDTIFLITKILAGIVVIVAGATLLYLLADFVLNCLAERQDVEASVIRTEREKHFYRTPIFTVRLLYFRITKRQLRM